MADANPNRLGQINGAGDDQAIFLKVFAGEVLTAFERANKFLPMVLSKSIASGKSGQFPATGRAVAKYHTPGTQLLGSDAIRQAEVVVPIDKKLATDEFIADIDEAKNHYDSRSIYSSEMGIVLATGLDTHILVEGVLGARAPETVTGVGGGTVIVDANLISAVDATRAQALIDAIFQAGEVLDGNDAPEENRWIALDPSDYSVLVRTVQTNGFSAVNADFGTEGGVASGKLFRLNGITLVKTNNLTKTDESAPAADSIFLEHPIDGTNTVSLVGCQRAIGVVKLMDLAMQSEFQIERQGTLMVASYALGLKHLRPECLVELASA